MRARESYESVLTCDGMGKKRRSKQKQEDRERRRHDWRRSAGLLKHAEGDGDDFKCPRDGDCFRIWFAIRPWHFGLSVTVRTIPHIMFMPPQPSAA